MAQVTPHPLLTSLSGKSGGLVFRQLRGRVVVAQAPAPSEAARSAEQVRRQDLFRDARRYAKTVLADPYQKKAYEARARAAGRRADLLLTADYLNPPEIQLVDASAYHGTPGDVIRVLATDDLEVASVEVSIATSAGVLVERGAASCVHDVWLYTAGTAAPDGEALTITAVAKDRPGNQTAARTAWPSQGGLN